MEIIKLLNSSPDELPTTSGFNEIFFEESEESIEDVKEIKIEIDPFE
jgi:hypothetical protein